MKTINFRKIFKVGVKKYISCFGCNADRDWKLVLSGGVLVFFISVFLVFRFGQFIDKKLNLEDNKIQNMTLSINRGLLSDTVNFFKEQERLFDETKSSSVGIKDPSI